MPKSVRSGRKMVMALYSHPEYYPPTLSALENLSPLYEKIFVVHGNVKGFDWKYPSNVELVGPDITFAAGVAEKKSFYKKLGFFFEFTRRLLRTIKSSRANTIVIYDYLPVLSYRIISRLIKKPAILWYHNHDVAEAGYVKQFSLAWWAWKSEKWIFPRLDIFSLPALERQNSFPMDFLRGKFYFIPNFPSKLIYRYENNLSASSRNTFRLLFQGSIGPDHGLEEIIPLLSLTVGGSSLELVLKGFVDSGYLESLMELAKLHAVENRIKYIGPSGYQEVIENTKSCQAGIAIHKKKDLMNRTLGTASNKIYEYAACGLTVLLFDNTHFRKILGNYRWAFFTDLSVESLKNCIREMIMDQQLLSRLAQKDFKDHLCFEEYFLPVLKKLAN